MTTTPSGSAPARPFWRAGLVAGVTAAVATTAIAAIASRLPDRR